MATDKDREKDRKARDKANLKLPLGAGPGGKIESFPLSELNDRVAKRDSDEAATDFAMGNVDDGAEFGRT